MTPDRRTEPRQALDLPGLLARAVASGDDGDLRSAMRAASGLPGPRLNLRAVDTFAESAAAIAVGGRSIDQLEHLLDSWAALPGRDSSDPAVILPCAAVLAYGAIGAARPDWWADEFAKLAAAALDPRWRVRELVAAACQRLLDHDWDRTVPGLLAWAGDQHPLRVRAAVASVAEPRLLVDPARWDAATAVQRAGIEWLAGQPIDERRADDVRTLRQALGSTLSVAAAASGDFSLLLQAARSGDPDLHWVAAENAKKKRLTRWPDALADLLAALAH